MMEDSEDFPRSSRGSGREIRFDRDWTKGSIFHNLLSLSWPISIGHSLNVLGPVIDMIWVGKLGAAAIAGVGISSMAVMLITSARMGLTQGTRAIIARFIGAGDTDGANHVGQQAFVISSGYTIVMASIGIFLAEPILILLGLEADVVTEGAAYMRIMFVGSVAMSFRMMVESIMQASGDSITPMRVSVFFRVFHAVLAPFLIFGWWIFPRLGVSGAAATNVISQSLGMAIGLWVLFSGRTRLRLTMRNFSLDLSMIWRIVKIGIPASIMTMERTLGNIVLMWFLVPFGTLAVAGNSLVQRIEMFLIMPCMGLGIGAGVLVGQNLGAGQPERAEKSGWLAVGVAEGFTIIASVAILLWAEEIIGIFNSEPDIVEMASTFLRIAAAGYLVLGLYAVLSHTISGTGDTLPPMLVTLMNLWLIQIPLAFLLPRFTNFGVYGVRWAIVAGINSAAVAYVVYFRLGRWKRKRV
ncbi:MATE family efflux transporter [Chloroflexota bacterium]